MRTAARRQVSAFTLVELIVVVTLIGIVLSITIPNLITMTETARENAAIQNINSALTRAYYAALADNTMTAVRFMPAEWYQQPEPGEEGAAGRQVLVTYTYVGTTAGDPQNPSAIVFAEYFQRRPGDSVVTLPTNFWAAPLEALETGRRTLNGVEYDNFGQAFVLNGDIGGFELNADPEQNQGEPARLLQADDFMIVFDPESGLRTVIEPRGMPVRAYVPEDYPDDMVAGAETYIRNQGTGNEIPYTRYNFSGIALYPRADFLALGERGWGRPAVQLARQAFLQRAGRPYLVHRHSGGLVRSAEQRRTEQ